MSMMGIMIWGITAALRVLEHMFNLEGFHMGKAKTYGLRRRISEISGESSETFILPELKSEGF